MTSMHKPYIPKTVGDVMDLIGSMTLDAPKFIDSSGYWPDLSIETAFQALNDGLLAIRARVGQENYKNLLELSKKARAHFEADQEDITEDGIKGRTCFLDMEDILKASARRKSNPGNDA